MQIKPKILLITIALLIVISFLGIWFLNSSSNRNIDDLKRIDAVNTFNQEDNEYIVYFWQSTCSYCQQIEEDVLAFSNNGSMPIYIVDMQEEQNIVSWYDWKSHHLKYDQEIGYLEDGEEMFNDDVNIEQFEKDTEVAWGIEITQDDKIIATHNTPYGNKEPKTAEEIVITGTPTMIKVKKGDFEHMLLEWMKR